MRVLIVRRGEDTKIPPQRRGEPSPHRRVVVYGAMYAQICRDYNVLPDLASITSEQIRWFYDMLRPDLHHQTKPKD